MELKESKQLMEQYPVMNEWMHTMPEDILSQCRVIKYNRGNALFRRGEKLSLVYVICEGTVMISSSNINGNEMGIVFVSAGSSVGEMEVLLGEGNLFYNAKVFSQSVLLEIPAKIFKSWIDKDAAVCKKIAMTLAEKLYSASSSTVKYKHLEAITRIKMLLSSHGAGKIQETKEELAEACGVSERTIHRAISVLAGEGMITCKNGKIEISQQQMRKIESSILEQI